MKRLHLTIHGRVQGVFFRAHTRDEASKLGLTGFVRNTPDGSVEIIAEGEHEDLERLVSWCYKGPPMARVDKIDTSWEEPVGGLGPFKVAH